MGSTAQRRQYAGKLAALLRGRDLAAAYVVVLLITAVFVFGQPEVAANQLVLDSSTNPHNLRARPLSVLLVSAFIVSHPLGLWLLPFLFWAYGTAQRWLGRAATILVAMFGHVFATVFVGVLITAGITHHWLDKSLGREPDVGVSYGLAAIGGLLVFRLSPHPRRRMIGVVTLLLLTRLTILQTFTEIGHLTAWGIGLSMGFVGCRLATELPGLSKAHQAPT